MADQRRSASVLSPYYEPREARDPLVWSPGNLVSPSRGVFVYSPFLILGAYELVRRSFGSVRLASLLRWQSIAALAALALYSSYSEWWGGYSYGIRYLAETEPLIACGLALWLRRHRRERVARGAVIALGAPAIAISAIGALFYDWSDWSWERLAGAQELMWRLDLAQPWYTVSRAVRAPDPVSIIAIATLLSGLALLAIAVRGASGPRTLEGT